MSASPRSPRPRLVLRFVAASLAAFLLIGGLVTVVMVHVVRERAEEHAEFHASYVVDAVLAPELGNIALDRPLAGGNLDRIDQLVHSRILSDGRSVRVKIWAPDGTILYSDDRALIGRRFPGEASELEGVLGGEVENGISNLRAPENVGERSIADKLFETYVPLRVGAQDAPVAIAEVYQDYSAIQQEVDALVRVLVGTFGVGLLVLYALLLPIALGAARTLRRNNVQLRDQAERLETLLSREQETVAELIHLNQMQADFVAAASHEFRTPLTSVIGYLRTLRQRTRLEDPAATEEFLAAAEHQATRLSLLVQKLLATAELQEGARRLDRSTFDLGELLEHVMQEVSEATERVRIDVAGAPVVTTDLERLHEILLNLVENALKYSPGGSPVEVEAEHAGDDLVIRVRDQGIGIEPGDRVAIFERFRQVDQSATRAFGGLGLGLHLTRELCADLGGSIDVESTPGRGSTFTVRVPRDAGVGDAGQPDASLAETSGSG